MQEKILMQASNELIDTVLTSATEVHRELGPGLFERVYEAALMMELANRAVKAESQVPIHVSYKGIDLGLGYVADVIVEDRLLLELKAVESFSGIHLAQTINYLRLAKMKRGFKLNFNTKLLKDGIKRVSI